MNKLDLTYGRSHIVIETDDSETFSRAVHYAAEMAARETERSMDVLRSAVANFDGGPSDESIAAFMQVCRDLGVPTPDAQDIHRMLDAAFTSEKAVRAAKAKAAADEFARKFRFQEGAEPGDA